MNATQVGAVSDLINAPFNNMQTMKFKIQPSVMLFTAVNHYSGSHTKQKQLPQWGQKVMFVCCDWQFSIHFVGFCIFAVSPLSLYISINSSKTR